MNVVLVVDHTEVVAVVGMIDNKHYVHRYSQPPSNESIIHNGDLSHGVSVVEAREPLGDPAAMLMHEDTPALLALAMAIKDFGQQILEKTGQPWKSCEKSLTNGLSLEEILDAIVVFHERLQQVPEARGKVRRGDYPDTDAIVDNSYLLFQQELRRMQQHHGNLKLSSELPRFDPPEQGLISTSKESPKRKRKQTTQDKKQRKTPKQKKPRKTPKQKKPRKTTKQKKSVSEEPLQTLVGDNESMPLADVCDDILDDIIAEDKDLMELFLWQTQDAQNDEIINLTTGALLEEFPDHQTVARDENEGLSLLRVPSHELEELGEETFESWAKDIDP